jgi:hemoglobin
MDGYDHPVSDESRVVPLGPGSVYDSLGGAEAFWRIARAFYARVEAESDPAFRGMFPADLEGAIQNQAEFLIQYFGGPGVYSERKGHPRLRARHMNFSIGLAERNKWVELMKGALDDAGVPEAVKKPMMVYFERTATFMMNAADPSDPY